MDTKRRYLGVAIPMTAVAIGLDRWSIHRVRGLLPDYPDQWAVGIYAPLGIAQAVHSIGSVGFVILMVVIGLFVVRRDNNKPLGGTARVILGTHLVALAGSIAVLGWCVFRAGRAAAILMQ